MEISTNRSKDLLNVLEERIAILDGAMGTMVHALGLDEQGFRGEPFRNNERDLKNCIDALTLSQPDAIKQIHASFLEAGADIVETNTFGATPVALADFGLEGHTRELNLAACRIAREAADAATLKTPDKPRFVAGSIGPTNKQLSIAGNVADPGHRDVTFDEMVACYKAQIEALLEGGVDLLLAETAFDTLVLKAALLAIEEAFRSTGIAVPIMASFTVFEGGRTLSIKLLMHATRVSLMPIYLVLVSTVHLALKSSAHTLQTFLVFALVWLAAIPTQGYRMRSGGSMKLQK